MNYEINKFIKIKSTAEKYENLTTDIILNKIKKYNRIIIWAVGGVCIKTSVEKEDLADFNEIRAFDANSEVHIVNVNGEFLGRKRIDGEGEEIQRYDELHKLWGDTKGFQKTKNGIRLTEDRGTEINLPFELNGNTAFIRVRNYYNDVFFDVRFVEFIGRSASEYGK
jgi:hypothetical protein